MLVKDITAHIESVAPLALQEDYDNAGLIIGDGSRACTGVLCTLDVTRPVIDEAISKNCNLILAHHPILFKGLKRINDKAIIKAVKNDIAIYACHTNIDNIITGVNGRIADKLKLSNRSVLDAKPSVLKKLHTFVPAEHLENVRTALFAAGAGHIGHYSECSFTHPGSGTFTPQEGTDPYIGKINERANVDETKLEVIFHAYNTSKVLNALVSSHPYEEVAYDVINLDNLNPNIGAGLVGDITESTEEDFITHLYRIFDLKVIKHTALTGKPVKRVAVCGGSGSFLISKALAARADVYITSDIKYHEFFAADDRMVICDIGHYESEHDTISLFIEILLQKFPTFAVLKSEVNTNPVRYFTGK